MLKKFKEHPAPLKHLPGERWTILKLNTKKKYLISTKGRIYSFFTDRILKGGLSDGIRTFTYYPKDKKIPYQNINTGITRRQAKRGDVGFTYPFLVASHFLVKPSGARYCAAHNNYNKLDDSV